MARGDRGGPLGGDRNGRPTVRSRHAALLPAIKRHIDRRLDAPRLDTDGLCRKFLLSRATLYRLFAPEGGLLRYVRDQRLRRAFTRLASSAHQQWRIIDIAIDASFASNATFDRAFRRCFGMTPSEVRRRVGQARPLGPTHPDPVEADLSARGPRRTVDGERLRITPMA